MIWEEKIHIALYYRRKFIHNYVGGEHIFVIKWAFILNYLFKNKMCPILKAVLITVWRKRDAAIRIITTSLYSFTISVLRIFNCIQYNKQGQWTESKDIFILEIQNKFMDKNRRRVKSYIICQEGWHARCYVILKILLSTPITPIT